MIKNLLFGLTLLLGSVLFVSCGSDDADDILNGDLADGWTDELIASEILNCAVDFPTAFDDECDCYINAAARTIPFADFSNPSADQLDDLSFAVSTACGEETAEVFNLSTGGTSVITTPPSIALTSTTLDGSTVSTTSGLSAPISALGSGLTTISFLRDDVALPAGNISFRATGTGDPFTTLSANPELISGDISTGFDWDVMLPPPPVGSSVYDIIIADVNGLADTVSFTVTGMTPTTPLSTPSAFQWTRVDGGTTTGNLGVFGLAYMSNGGSAAGGFNAIINSTATKMVIITGAIPTTQEDLALIIDANPAVTSRNYGFTTGSFGNPNIDDVNEYLGVRNNGIDYLLFVQETESEQTAPGAGTTVRINGTSQN